MRDSACFRPDDIFAAVREHGSIIRALNLQLQVCGFDTLPAWLQHEIREHRYELIKALGTAGWRSGDT